MTHPSLFSGFRTLLQRDLLLAWRRRGDAAMPVLYAMVVAILFPFALGPDHQLLARVSGGIVLVTVLLAMLLALDNLFRSDLEDGVLAQMVIAPQSLSFLMAARILAYWLVTAFPLLIAGPILGYMLGLPAQAQPVLFLALVLSSALLALLGSMLAALTAGTRRSGMLLSLMLLPLIVPVVIFAAGAVSAVEQGLPWVAPLAWLSATLALTLVLAPVACATALRITLDA